MRFSADDRRLGARDRRCGAVAGPGANGMCDLGADAIVALGVKVVEGHDFRSLRVTRHEAPCLPEKTEARPGLDRGFRAPGMDVKSLGEQRRLFRCCCSCGATVGYPGGAGGSASERSDGKARNQTQGCVVDHDEGPEAEAGGRGKFRPGEA